MTERRPKAPPDPPGREIRWVVRAGDGPTLGDVVRHAGGDAAAVREGRVFIGRTRAQDETTPLAEGQIVTLAAKRDAIASVHVLAAEEGVVAVNKPAGMPTIPDQGGSAHTLLALLAEKLRCPLGELHATSRLDREVSGVVLFARSRQAAERLKTARGRGEYFRRYAAIACRAPDPPRGQWNAPIGRDRDPKKRAAFGLDAAAASSAYQVVATAEGRALLALEPATGRTHQLRVHAAYAGAALLGDRAYGGESRVVLSSGRVEGLRRIALHAGLVIVPRPSGGTLEVRAPIPPELRELWTALGGRDEAWVHALGKTTGVC
jgi:23S rRNA pseudouridine1911/1915/1917 synthase